MQNLVALYIIRKMVLWVGCPVVLRGILQKYMADQQKIGQFNNKQIHTTRKYIRKYGGGAIFLKNQKKYGFENCTFKDNYSDDVCEMKY